MMAKSITGRRAIDTIDLTIFVDMLHRVQRFRSVGRHAYGSMSGFALDDQRKLYRSLGLTRLLAFSDSEIGAKRQMFNKPLIQARRVEAEFDTIVANWRELFEAEGIEDTDKFILWLRRNSAIDAASGPRQFQELAGSIGIDGILRITLEVDFEDWAGPEFTTAGRLTVPEREERVRGRVETDLGDFLVSEDFRDPIDLDALCKVLAKAYGYAAAQEVAEKTDRAFVPISILRYGTDPVEVTISGMVVAKSNRNTLKNAISDGGWPFASKDWGDVKTLIVPDLTVKERIDLEKTGGNRERAKEDLGFDLDEAVGVAGAFQSFADFHRYLPTMVSAEM